MSREALPRADKDAAEERSRRSDPLTREMLPHADEERSLRSDRVTLETARVRVPGPGSRPASVHLAMPQASEMLNARRRTRSAPPALARGARGLRSGVQYPAPPFASLANAAPLLQPPRAHLSCAKEDCIPIRVETMSPRHAVTVVVQRSDYEPLASMGPAAIRWAVCCALRRTFKVGAKFPLQTATLLVRADGRSGASAPYDWEGLGRFVEEGGTARLQCHLPAGMDSGSELLQKTQLNEDSIPWDAVDADLIRVRRGEEPESQDSPTYALAKALFANIKLGQLEPLDALPDDIRARGLISPARMAALAIVVKRAQLDMAPPTPSWVATGQWVELRLNSIRFDVLDISGEAPNMQEQLTSALFRKLVGLVPELLTPSTRWTRISRCLRLDADWKAPGVFSARLQLPQGPWIPALLEGRIAILTDSYFTLAPHEGYCEVEIDSAGGRLLRAIGRCLNISEHHFRALLNTTMRLAFNSESASARISTSRFIPGVKGQKSTTRYFHPSSDEADIVVGIDAMSVLMVGRTGPTVTVRLGGISALGHEFPVAISIFSPPCPRRTLYTLVDTKHKPLQGRPPHSQDGSRVIVLAPLPKGWIQVVAGTSAAGKTAAEEWLELLWQRSLGATTLWLLGRYSKQGDPIALYAEFVSADSANAFVQQYHTATLPTDVQAAMDAMFPGTTLEIFSCRIPAEALAVLKEKDLLSLLEHARSNPCPVPDLAAAAGSGGDARPPQ